MFMARKLAGPPLTKAAGLQENNMERQMSRDH
jgi:hypothetical protein